MAFKKKKTAPVEEVATPNEEVVTEEICEEEVEKVVEEKKEEKKGKVTVKEEEYKSVNLLKAPEEIKKIVQFYGITSKDLFEGKLDGVKAEEAKALKEWYASLV